jgi:drug/metabolite transporter (DMT)-like permease
VTFLIPVFAMAWGLIFLHETVSGSMILGAAIILVGTFLVAARRGTPRGKPESASGGAAAVQAQGARVY